VAAGWVRGQSARPDFQALIYPGRLQRIEPATNSPVAFLVCGYGDRPDISEDLATVYLKFKQLKVPAELHLQAGSGHGFGLRATDPKLAVIWIEGFEAWLAYSKFLNRSSTLIVAKSTRFAARRAVAVFHQQKISED